MSEKILVALGGNALVRAGQRGTIEEQAANLNRALTGVVPLIQRGCRVIVTHGNGPQVGHILLRVEAARQQAYDLPLDVCVAQSQGEIGYLLQQSLQNMLRRARIERPVATILCQTLVDKQDPRMKSPSKPVNEESFEAGWPILRQGGSDGFTEAGLLSGGRFPSRIPAGGAISGAYSDRGETDHSAST